MKRRDLEGAPRFVCGIYTRRPLACREYPWKRFGQLYFQDCIFYEDGTMLSWEEATARFGEQETIDYCCRCNLCCYSSNDKDFPDQVYASILSSASDWWKNEGGKKCPMLHKVSDGVTIPNEADSPESG